MKIHRDLTQGTEEWFKKKLGVITGTVLADIMGTPYKKGEVLYELVAERLTENVDTEYESAMARGTRLEPEAVAVFEYITGKKIERVGFCERDDNQFIGYSPDGLVADTDYTEDIEIKCPLGKNYIKIVLTNEVPKEYYHQLIQGFVVNSNLLKRYFIAYNPDIPSYPMHIIEVLRKDLESEIEEAYQSQLETLDSVDQLLKNINLK